MCKKGVMGRFGVKGFDLASPIKKSNPGMIDRDCFHV
jgi:hypothetical protein